MDYVEEMQNLYQNYQHSFVTLANLFDETGQKENVAAVLEMMDKVLPESLLPYTNEELKAEADKLREKGSFKRSTFEPRMAPRVPRPGTRRYLATLRNTVPTASTPSETGCMKSQMMKATKARNLNWKTS